MAIHLTPYDGHLLERYLDWVMTTANSSRDTRAVRANLTDLIEMVARHDPGFRLHLRDAIKEIGDA